MKRAIVLALVLTVYGCSKEKILSRNGFPDQGDIFISAYITNGKDNRIAVFGKELLDQQIELYLDSGQGFHKLPLKYIPSEFEFESDLSKINFKPLQVYRIKLVSRSLNDSLILFKTLPDSFMPSNIVSYPNKNEYYCTLKVNDGQNKAKYLHDLRYSGSEFDTTSFQISNTGNIYRSTLLPYLRDIDGHFEPLTSLESLNSLDIFEGIRFPFYDIYNANASCAYNAFVKKFNIVLTRFYVDDFKYIDALCDNVSNYGNPFFQNYQPKGLTFSHTGKLFGIFISSYSTYTSVTVADHSDTAIKITVQDNGVDMIGNQNYLVGYNIHKNFATRLYTATNLYFGTENLIRYFYDCPSGSYRRNDMATVQFKVYNKTTRITKFTDIQTFDLIKTPISLVFEVQ